jgi:REP element-mobilizing transposase RayT
MQKPNRKRLRRRGGVGQVRFLTFSCEHRRRLLSLPRHRDLFAKHLGAWIGAHDIALHAWVVMSNHVHLLLTPRSGCIAQSLSVLKQELATELLRELEGERALWQAGGGYDRLIWSHQHFWKSFDYIHRNPCTTGLAKLPEDWRWSSAREWYGKPRVDAPQVEPLPDNLIDLVGTS